MTNIQLEIQQGADFKMHLTLKDSSGALIDLTGHTFSGDIKKNFAQSAPSGSFTFNVLNQVTNMGEVEVLMSAAASKLLPIDVPAGAQRTPTRFVYDIISDSGSEIVRWLQGDILLSPEVTA